MKTLPASLALLALALSAPCLVSAEQEQAPNHDPLDPIPLIPPGSTIQWPPGIGGGGPFRRIVTGDFTGNLLNDAVVLDGDTAVLLYVPHMYTALQEISPGIPVIDCAVLAGAGTGGGDLLLTTDVSGLARHTYDPLLEEFQRSMINTWRWRSAKCVITANLDGEHGDDILGIAYNDVSLLTLLDDGDGGFDGDFSVMFEGAVRELAVLDLNADGIQDVAGISDYGLEVYDPSGEPLLVIPTDIAGGAIAVLPRAGEPGDYLAWIEHDPSGEFDSLHVFDAQGEVGTPLLLSFPPIVDLPPISIDSYGMRTGDLDGDGDLDLVVAQKSFQSVLGLYNRWEESGNTQHFSTEPGTFRRYHLAFDPSQTAQANQSVPGVADLDQDGTADVVAGVENVREIRVLTSNGVLAPPFEGSGQTSPLISGSVFQHARYGPDPQQNSVGEMELFLEVPDEVLAHVDPVYDHIQVIIWRQTDEGEDLDNIRVDNVLYRMDLNGPGDIHYQRILVDVPGADPTYPWEAPEREHYYLHLRFANVDPLPNTPHVLAATKNVASGMTIAPDDTGSLEYRLYLGTLPTADFGIDIEPTEILLVTTIIGIEVPLGRIPNFTPNYQPKIGQPAQLIQSSTIWDPNRY